jgi:hypothetical protein
MGLRDYINNKDWAKKVNLSEKGRKFENGDFARTIEWGIQTVCDKFSEQNISSKIEAIALASMLPINYVQLYGIVKGVEIPEGFSYKKFNFFR